MLKRILSFGLLTSAFLLAACDDGGTSNTGSTASTSSTSSAGGSGGMGGSVSAPPVDVDPLVGIGAVEQVQANFQFTEGPQWIPARKSLFFTDIPANTIHELVPGTGVSVFRTPSDNANGLALDEPTAFLLACEHGARRVSRTKANGTIETVVDMYEGKKLNSPNDIIVRKDGNIYFTDPPYGLADPGQSELGYAGIFRVTSAGALELIDKDFSTPNGIALSPDQKTLYVDDTMSGALRAYPLNADGSVGPAQMLAQTSGDPDGMTVDQAGNIYVATKTGVQVFKPDGTARGNIAVPEQPANCAFGGEDHKTLYITARKGLYSVSMVVPGLY